ncbi:hypothetical protein F4678DRAFT_441946 [Xylaria arbuscula]|nr:hypothetical protein F4678DRAFT_441946 [Xylaria arbuscula]
MSTEAQSRVAVKCAENIGLLYLLHRVPAQPSSNPVTAIQSKAAGHALPFDIERILVSTLAFLANIDDDPDDIPAVCLQETTQDGGLNVLLAVNRKGLTTRWKRYASDIKVGFDRIIAALRRVDNHARDIERDVFALIIELSKERILCRLRFAKKLRDSASKKRMTITDGLQRVVEYLGRSPTEATKLFLGKAQNVLKLAEIWKKYQTSVSLGALVDGINSLRQTENFRAVLGSVPNREMDASMRSHLLRMTCKVARYRESARTLSRVALEFPQVQGMGVVVVELQDKAFTRPATSNDYHATIDSTISRIPNLKATLKDVQNMCNLLRLPIEEANTKYDDQVKDALRNSKVHAEIQLLYYCQSESKLPRKPLLPRIICSSKSACWLCNAFMLLHGIFHMPRSHGRLYPGWCLPNLDNDIATRFNRHLENAVVESLRTLHSRKKPTKYPDPIESEMSTITWNSLPLPPQSQISKRSGMIITEKESEQLKPILVHYSSGSPEQIGAADKCQTSFEKETEATYAVLEKVASSESSASGSATSTVLAVPSTSANSSSSSAETPQEETIPYRVSLGEVSPIYTSGPLKLQFEYAAGSKQQALSDESQKQLSCTAEWLSSQDVEQLKIQGVTAIDLESLTGEEISCSTDSTNNIYLSHGDAVLRVMMRPA